MFTVDLMKKWITIVYHQQQVFLNNFNKVAFHSLKQSLCVYMYIYLLSYSCVLISLIY